MDNLINWIDLLWVPVAALVLHKGTRIKGMIFVLCCALILRLQVELMEKIGYPRGIINMMDFPLLERGYIVYGLFIATFLILCHYAHEKDPYIFIAASISVFILAFCVSSFILVL